MATKYKIRHCVYPKDIVEELQKQNSKKKNRRVTDWRIIKSPYAGEGFLLIMELFSWKKRK